jgi:transposase
VASVAAARRHDLTDAQWAVLAPALPCCVGARSSAQVDQAAEHRRDRLAGPDRGAVAGRARGVSALADAVSVVSLLAARGRHRAGRSRVGPLAGRVDHQDAAGVRAGPQGLGGSGHRWAARRQPAVHPGAGPDPGGAGRYGIKACIPSKADQAAHRRAEGSKGGRPPAFDPITYRQRHAVECGSNQLNQLRADGHPLRQASRPLRSHPDRRRHQPMAPSSTKHGLGPQPPQALGAAWSWVHDGLAEQELRWLLIPAGAPPVSSARG